MEEAVAFKDSVLTTEKTVRKGNFGIALAIILSATGMFAGAVSAQVGPPRTSSQLGISYESKLSTMGEFKPLDNSMFGEQINLFTGGMRFVQTDIDLPGNNALPMRVTRSYSPGRSANSSIPVELALNYTQFADWDLEIPYITGTYGKSGWVSMAGPRCSVPRNDVMKASPPSEYVPAEGNPGVGIAFDPHFYWSGNSLHLPEQGDTRMMVLAPESKAPNDGRSYHWSTANRWVFSCLPTTSNGYQGEGFMALAPDGTRYWFDWIVTRSSGNMESWFGIDVYQYVSRMSLYRYKALPTRMEDRYGNFITFNYFSDRPHVLQSMTASDGRSIVFRPIGSAGMDVDAGGRTWSYRYSNTTGQNPTLRTATLPDGSSWSFEAEGSSGEALNGWRNCADYVPGISKGSTLSITHPSGATGTFSLSTRLHGRTAARNTCRTHGAALLPVESHILRALSINRKVISGPGLATLSWDYSYSPLAASLDTGQHVVCQTTPCPETRDVTVTRENGAWARYTFSQKFGDLEGKMLREEHGGAAGILNSTDYQYRRTSDGTYARVGADPCWVCSKEEEMPKPLSSKIIHQDGRTFTLQVEQYDAFARPTRLTRSSPP